MSAIVVRQNDAHTVRASVSIDPESVSPRAKWLVSRIIFSPGMKSPSAPGYDNRLLDEYASLIVDGLFDARAIDYLDNVMGRRLPVHVTVHNGYTVDWRCEMYVAEISARTDGVSTVRIKGMQVARIVARKMAGMG